MQVETSVLSDQFPVKTLNFIMGLVILLVLFSSAFAANLQELLHKTDEFFLVPRSASEIESFQNSLINSDPPLGRAKREASKQGNLVFRGAGAVKFSDFNLPYDLNGFELNGKLYVVSVQRFMPDGGKSQKILLVLYKIEEKTSRFLMKVPLEADGVIEIQPMRNNVLIAVSHKSLDRRYQGCSIYSMVNETLVRSQFLDTPFPLDIKFGSNFQKVYLAVSTPSSVEIFEWKGRHFDNAQELELKDVTAIRFFRMDNILFLVTAHDNEINGVPCSVWEQSLENGMFTCRQYLERKLATSVSYFRLKGLSQQHFLIFGYRDNTSVVYKLQGQMFQPFQRIAGAGTMQWLPYEDSESFVLFQLTDRVIPFTYNGWSFVPTNVPVNHDVLRLGCTKLRRLRKTNGPWLIAVNQRMEMGAMMELEFERQAPQYDTSELNTWCESQKTFQDITTLNEKFQSVPSADDDLVLNQNLVFQQLRVENLKAKKFQGLDESLVDSINDVASTVEDLQQILDDVETLSMASFNTITLKGPIESENLLLTCDENAPCVIPKLNAILMNDIPVEDFLTSIVSISNGIFSQGHLHFETLRATNTSSIYFNDNLADSIISRKDNLNLGNRLTVNGTVTFDGKLFIGGEIQDVVLDREHAVLASEDQFLDGELMLDTARVRNLTITESINGAKVQELGMDVDPNSHGLWEVLTVGNLTVRGKISGHPVWKFFTPEDIVKADDVNVKDGKLSDVEISNLVRIDEGDYVINSDITLEQPTRVENLHVTDSINQIPLILMVKLATGNESVQSEPIKLRSVVGDEIVVKGRATVKDIVRGNNSLHQVITGGTKDDEESPYGVIETCVGSKCETQVLQDGVFSFDEIVANSLNITGKVNGLNWTDFVDDAVFKGFNVTVVGKKSVEGILNITDLVIDGVINNQTVDEFLNRSYNAVFDDVLTVENLYLNGRALLSDENLPNDEGYFFLSNVYFESGVNLKTIDGIDFDNFVQNVAYINESTRLDNVDFLTTVTVQNLTNYNLLNGANFHDTVVVKNSTKPQVIDGQWLFHNNLVIDGDLIVHGEINGMDLGVLCEMTRNPPKVIVGGSVHTLSEPLVTNRVNDLDMGELLNNLWFKNQPTILKENVKIANITIQGKVELHGNLNGIKIEHLAKGYLSKTIPRRMLSPITIKNLTSLGMVRASNITGEVNGVKLGAFAEKVLLYGVDQTFNWRPHFHELILSDLEQNCTINGMNLETDVLRYSVESRVTGPKTVTEILTKKLTMPDGKLLQGVDFTAWTRDVVLKNHTVISGNITFETVDIKEFLNVAGTIGGIKFDNDHLLTVNGNQTITGLKIFTGNVSIESLTLNGPVNGTDLNNILENSAYSDRDVILKCATEIENIQASHLKLSGTVAGVNISNFCSLAENRVEIHTYHDDYSKLFTAATEVHDNLANGAYYLDHYELVQKFDRNVSAIVRLPQASELTIAVFRKYGVDRNVTLMVWDPRDHIFRTKKQELHDVFSGNTSLISSGSSHILVETWEQGGVLLYKNREFHLNVTETTCAVPFQLNLNTICVFLGQVRQRDALMCADEMNQSDFQVVQTFNATHCTQAASVRTANSTWLAVIGAKVFRSASELFVTVFSKPDEGGEFRPRQDLPVLHPVSVSATMHRMFSYLVVASQHQPGSVRSSLLAIFRYTAMGDKWTRYQEISVEAPRFVSFKHLPTGQLALYVLTDNPARAFLVYLYRGIEGFVEETAGLAVHPGKFLSPFNDGADHFVGIAGDGFSQLLQAHFLGRRVGL